MLFVRIMLFFFFFFFFATDFWKCFLLSCLVFIYWHIVCLFQVWFSNIRSAFNLLVLPNSMFTPFFLYERAMCSLEKWHLKITIIIINGLFLGFMLFITQIVQKCAPSKYFQLLIHGHIYTDLFVVLLIDYFLTSSCLCTQIEQKCASSRYFQMLIHGHPSQQCCWLCTISIYVKYSRFV